MALRPHDHTGTDHEHAEEHHIGKPVYNLIFIILAALTALEVIWAELDMPGALHIGVLMLISLFKAGLVMAFYMHLKYDSPMFTWIFIIPFLMGTAVIISFQGLAGY